MKLLDNDEITWLLNVARRVKHETEHPTAVAALEWLRDGRPDEQWAVKDHGVLHAPGFKVVGSQGEAGQLARNMGTEEKPFWHYVPAVRTVVELDGREFYSGWTLRPTEEQQRLSGWPAEQEYRG
jgi:hypothetical protein